MIVESIWEATKWECPGELKEQADDFQKILDAINEYSDTYDLSYGTVMKDVDRALDY